MKQKHPHAISDILGQLFARRGFARVQSADACSAAWRQAAGDFTAGYTRVGSVKRGALEITVANSTLVQELTFRKSALLADLARLLPDEPIKDLRFRVGPIE
jgi:predicted nucleic acid-binding Zn ribbon protein